MEKTERTENYFFLLELPFDPAEDDPQTIQAAIGRKKDQWTRESQRSPKFDRYLSLQSDIQRVMLDAELRGAEAERARKIKQGAQAELEERLKLCRAIGDTLSDQALAQLLERFALSGFTGEEIRQRFACMGGQEEKAQEIGPAEVLGRRQAQKIKKCLRQLYPSGGTLYAFLGLEAGASVDQLQKAADAMGRQFLASGKRTPEGDLKQELCGLCKTVFADQAGKRRYDNYVELTRHPGLNDAVDEYAQNHQQCLSARVKERLIDFAVRHCELSVVDAAVYIDNYCAYMDYAVAEDKVVCSRCGAENSARSADCVQCGEPLFIRCPSCGRRCAAGAKVCSACQFRLEDAGKVRDLCAQAERALAGLDFQAAEAHLAAAERLWPASELVQPLRARLSEQRRQIGARGAQLREAVRARQYVEAQRQYDAIRSLFPEYREPALEQEMGNAIRGARSLCAQASRSSRRDEVLDLCGQAAALCADLPDIRELSERYPPDPPQGLSVRPDPHARGNAVSWTVSAGGRPERCILVRSRTGRVYGPCDGEEIFRGDASSYWDGDLEPGVPYWYNVFAERGGVFSRGAAEGGREAVALFEAGQVSVTPGDRSLRLSWGPLPSNAKVELYRSVPGGEEHLASTREGSFLVSGLANGLEQRFRVALSYLCGGRRLETAGIWVCAAPVCPPTQVASLQVRSVRAGAYEAVWRHAGQGEVRLFAGARRPGRSAGAVVPLSALEREMTPLQTQPLPPDRAGRLRPEEGGACFRDPGWETLYVTAAAVQSGAAVLGPLVRAGRAAAVAIRDVRTVNGRIHLFLDAPRDASGFQVSYRFDRPPADRADPEAVTLCLTRQQYEEHNALRLEAPEERTYHFLVWAWFDGAGEREWSPGAERTFDCSPRAVITYSISPPRGLFGRGFATMEFQADGRRFTLPDIDVLSAVGAAPMFRDKAKLLYTIAAQEVEGSLKVKIPLPQGTPKGTYIKPFFRDEAAQAKSQLRLGLRSDHKIT